MNAKIVHILYMEDDQGLARLLQKRLEREGYTVEIAHNGEEGIAMLGKAAYDVLLVDYNMPVVGGLEVIRALSSRGALPPTIMITGLGNESVAVEALKLGASDYIVKDIDQGYLELLPIVIEQVIKERRIVSEHKKMEVELLKAQKLESIGVLAGGIAHDFNNLLTAIIGNIALAKMRLSPEDELFSLLDKAEKISLRASTLTSHLITFSRGGAPRRKTLVLTDLVKDTVHLSLSGSNYRSEFAMDRDLWPVDADEGQIHQVIHAIVRNAMDAMPKGGTITVSAGNVTIGQDESGPLSQGPYIRLSVHDCGTGISEENLPKIFDPYFSTKEMGSQKGMGLGLAICYSIVKNHGGLITAESQAGTGTTVHIYLPALSPSVELRELPVSSVSGGSGAVLIMDDEKTILEVSGEMLRQLGYTVVCARDGEEALARYREALAAGRTFDAVILDLTVSGGMGGLETMIKLRELDPLVKAIVSSGYSQDPVMRDYEEGGFQGAIVKPYKLSALADTVGRVARSARKDSLP